LAVISLLFVFSFVLVSKAFYHHSRRNKIPSNVNTLHGLAETCFSLPSTLSSPVLWPLQRHKLDPYHHQFVSNILQYPGLLLRVQAFATGDYAPRTNTIWTFLSQASSLVFLRVEAGNNGLALFNAVADSKCQLRSVPSSSPLPLLTLKLEPLLHVLVLLMRMSRQRSLGYHLQ